MGKPKLLAERILTEPLYRFTADTMVRDTPEHTERSRGWISSSALYEGTDVARYMMRRASPSQMVNGMMSGALRVKPLAKMRFFVEVEYPPFGKDREDCRLGMFYSVESLDHAYSTYAEITDRQTALAVIAARKNVTEEQAKEAENRACSALNESTQIRQGIAERIEDKNVRSYYFAFLERLDFEQPDGIDKFFAKLDQLGAKNVLHTHFFSATDDSVAGPILNSRLYVDEDGCILTDFVTTISALLNHPPMDEDKALSFVRVSMLCHVVVGALAADWAVAEWAPVGPKERKYRTVRMSKEKLEWLKNTKSEQNS